MSWHIACAIKVLQQKYVSISENVIDCENDQCVRQCDFLTRAMGRATYYYVYWVSSFGLLGKRRHWIPKRRLFEFLRCPFVFLRLFTQASPETLPPSSLSLSQRRGVGALDIYHLFFCRGNTHRAVRFPTAWLDCVTVIEPVVSFLTVTRPISVQGDGAGAIKMGGVHPSRLVAGQQDDYTDAKKNGKRARDEDGASSNQSSRPAKKTQLP